MMEWQPIERIERQSMPEPNSGCWIWLGSTRNGYGRLTIGSRTDGTRKSISAHRLSFEAHNGPIPDGLYVCHKCDTPACVNPDHLFLGTHMDNVADRERKGRNYPPPISRGNSHPSAKVPDSVIAAIRASDQSSAVEARKYGLNDSYIRQIRRGEHRTTPRGTER